MVFLKENFREIIEIENSKNFGKKTIGIKATQLFWDIYNKF